MVPSWLTMSDETTHALRDGRSVVALESTLITHGLPWPTNLDTARAAETAVREAGAVPATIAIIDGQPMLGLAAGQLERLAQSSDVLKASTRDIGYAMATRRTAGTTVAATMAIAHAAGISVFATGGIGGAHRGDGLPLDISSDLHELSRTPVLVVCAGAKSILDLPRTLEILETFGVPVFGYRTDEFPAFYVKAAGLPVSARVNSASEAALAFAAHRRIGGAGALLAQPVEDRLAIPPAEFDAAFLQADREAKSAGIIGGQLTPFLLGRLAELTIGRTLAANQALIVENARLAAAVAVELTRITDDSRPRAASDDI